LQARYAAQSTYSSAGYWLPAQELISRIARNAVYEEVAKLDSLVIHTRREELATAVVRQMQTELDKTDRGIFTVSRVVVRQATTDPSIEQSIQQAVANQKRLEAMQVQTEIAKKEAEIKITEAQGIARANQIINQSLTREYLQHETNLALMKFAEKGSNHTIVVPANMSVAPLINTGPAK
jgi:hypothetical protein